MTKVLNVMESYVGYLEKKSNSQLDSKTANAGSNNYTRFGRDYEKQMGVKGFINAAWCAMFVSICFVEAYGLAAAKKLLCGNLFAYCPYFLNAFKKKGQLHTKPKAGDIIFYLRNGTAYHVGYVYKVSGSYVYTIEGNTSGGSGVVANGGGVFKKAYYVNSNMRFARPDYSLVGGAAATASKYTVSELKKDLGSNYPTLSKGSKGTTVTYLQLALNDIYGYDLAVDGSFGGATLAAVKDFQKAKGLTVDGVVGAKTWGALLGNTETKASKYTKSQFIKDVQGAIGVVVDGKVGAKTRAALPTLKKVTKHPVVKYVQRALNEFYGSSLAVDGSYGGETAKAVMAFQKTKGLSVDGVCGKNTWKALIE